MNSLDLTDCPGSATTATTPAISPRGAESVTASPLERLVAGICRRAAVPNGYRFIANLDADDRERALVALRHGSGTGELLLNSAACDEIGRPVPGLALYVRADRPEPQVFWILFHALGQRTAAITSPPQRRYTL